MGDGTVRCVSLRRQPACRASTLWKCTREQMMLTDQDPLREQGELDAKLVESRLRRTFPKGIFHACTAHERCAIPC